MVPLLVWLLCAFAGGCALSWQEHLSRQAVVQRFNLRIDLMGDYVASYAADLVDRERLQANTSLADPVVPRREFERAVAGFGYPAAVLLDAHGRVLRVVPSDPSLIGRDLTGRYPHLRTALREGRPAVSPVVRSAARGLPVVAFAVPFETPSGRRVFSGAVGVRASPLSSYLASALSLSGAQVQLVDDNGVVVAANRPLPASTPDLEGLDDRLAAALADRPQGSYTAVGERWQYSSTAIAGTPWRLSATVRQEVFFASLHDNEIAGRAALGGAVAVGLLVVVAVTRARRSRHELQLSEHRFRRIFDGSRLPMTLTDAQGRFVRVNPAACLLFGRTEDDLVGSSFVDVTHPDDTTMPVGLVRDCLAGRIDAFDVDKRYVSADGRIIDASVTVCLLRDGQGRPQYFATQIVDMTERRALERARLASEAELAQRAEQLQEANAHLADVIAMLSHDVRQPLFNIVGLGELLLDDWTDSGHEEKRRDVQRMTAAGHRASNLVTDILTLAQLDAGALVARPVRVDLSRAVREAAAAHRASGAANITVLAPDETSGLADPAHLQLILGNLLSNATKYGQPPFTVTVSNRREHVEIRVADHGEGVPDAFVAQLFDRFARAGTGVATAKPGTGLGLYLVRQLARAGGLDVSYQPNDPCGAAFLIAIPFVPAEPGLTSADVRQLGDNKDRRTV
jgi:PAS domain S-box-containing protein